MKKYIILLVSMFALTTFVPSYVVAQRRAQADRFEQKAAKKSSDAQASQAASVAVTTTAVPTSSPAAKTTKAVKSKTAPASAIAPTSSSPKAAYNQLLVRLGDIQTQLDALSTELSGLRGGKAKKIVAQIDALQREKASLTAQKALFPRSITDPEYAQAQEMRQREEYKAELAAQTADVIAKSDPFAEKMSDDPELQKAYREYVDTFMPRQQDNASYASGDKVYRVMFAISKKAISVQEIQTYGQILEQRLPSGGVAYYVGTFASRDAAQGVCNKILASGKYRDAFVVAMVGNKRVPL